MVRWWVGKYKRPPNDPLLLSRSVESLEDEYLEDLFVEHRSVSRAIDDGEIEDPLVLAKLRSRRAELAEVLKEMVRDAPVRDVVYDEWERDWAAGRAPKLGTPILDAKGRITGFTKE